MFYPGLREQYLNQVCWVACEEDTLQAQLQEPACHKPHNYLLLVASLVCDMLLHCPVVGVEAEVIFHNLLAQNCCKENIHVGGHSLVVEEEKC